MKELKCPKCSSVFTVDEADYSLILQQVKTVEFNAEVEKRLEEIRKTEEAKSEMALVKVRSEAADSLKEKDLYIANIKAAMEKKDEELRLALLEKEKEDLMVVAGKDAEIAELKAEIAKKDGEVKAKLAEKAVEEQALVARKDSEISKIKSEFEAQLKSANEQIAFYKDMKAKMSTKMVGETLEMHCSTQYDQFMRFALPNATFEKDNEVAGGTKGDFIFRDYALDGTEYVSIMFEMKNEADAT
ncbi:MAG: DUF2130 domain-containing protein, partial [Kiritimatiellae bacterium]|nr:DUF2130 domain-containing protein [Kiritimatiellia bacterium]